MNEFLLRHARQNHDHGGAKTFLAIDGKKNDRAAAWYAGYGATPLVDAALTLVLPLATIERLLKDVGKLVP